MADLTVANMIYHQLGGHQFAVMTGAKNFVGSPDSLTFQLPATYNGVNGVRIVYDSGTDLYLVEFVKVSTRRGQYRRVVVKRLEFVYFDQLVPIFESVTGLRTSLTQTFA